MSICSCPYSKLSTKEHLRRGINEGQSKRLIPLLRSHNTSDIFLFIKHPVCCGADPLSTKNKSPKKTKEKERSCEEN